MPASACRPAASSEGCAERSCEVGALTTTVLPARKQAQRSEEPLCPGSHDVVEPDPNSGRLLQRLSLVLDGG